MGDDEILQLVEDGTIDADDITEFRDLDDEIQQLVADGEIDMEDARELM